MAEERIVVSDDWTKNWQAKIAVKTTAIFLWMVIAVGFFGLVLSTQDLEEEINQKIGHDVDSIAFHAISLFSSAPPSAAPDERGQLVRLFLNEIAESEIEAIRIQVAGTEVSVGNIESHWESKRRTIENFSPSWSEDPVEFSVTAYHTPVLDLVWDSRGWSLVIMAAVILCIGMILSMTINNVLAKPFEVLVAATQAVSRGNLDLRLDVSREDEFGQLSRFFNRMLETIKRQQDELTHVNEGLITEIGVRKRAEQDLKHHRDQLERLVQVRTQDLKAARDQALQASKTKSAFIANISHEIRTPLTPIVGFAEVILDGHQSPQEQRLSLKSIIRNSKHLLTLINDILDLSKIEADHLEVEKISVDPFELMQDVDSLVGMLAREKGLEYETRYEFPIPRRISTDPFRLKQVLINLASNAVKFTEKGFVHILIRYDADECCLFITVADTGIGVSQDKQERLFEAFSQADSSTTREYGGTGLGLYISQQLARLLGGAITMESIVGVGSRFVLRLETGAFEASDMVHEYDRHSDSSTENESANALGSLQGKVLLAEDNPDNQRLISYYVERFGADVAVCENGKLAVEEALATDYDLVLMDMQMPVMGGAEAVETLRSRGFSKPIVALTANAMKEDVQKYLQIGCDGFLGKPIDKAGFYSVLREYLGGTGAEAGVDEEDADYDALLKRFVSDLPRRMEELKTAVENEQWADVSDFAHQLRGSGGSYGFASITAAAAQLELQVKQSQFEQAADGVLALEEVVKSVIREHDLG